MKNWWGFLAGSAAVAACISSVAACVGDDAGTTTVIEKDGASSTPETSNLPDTGSVDATDSMVDAPNETGIDAGPACDPDGELGIPTPVAGFGTAGDETGFAISADGLDAIVQRSNGDYSSQIRLRRLNTAVAFAEVGPAVVPAVQHQKYAMPALSPDGRTLYFSHALLQGGQYDLQIVYATRATTTDAFGMYAPMPGASTQFISKLASALPIANVLYFIEYRGEGGNHYLMRSQGGGAPTTQLGPAYGFKFFAISPDQKRLFIGENSSGKNVVSSFRRDFVEAGWSAEAKLANLTSTVDVYPVAVSSDACTVYLAGAAGAYPGGAGGYDIYASKRAAKK